MFDMLATGKDYAYPCTTSATYICHSFLQHGIRPARNPHWGHNQLHKTPAIGEL